MPDPSKTVIILEDDDDIADLLAQLISSYGAVPLVCDNQDAVMQAMEERAVALGLLDIMLPGSDGREVLAALRERNASFPVYFMTGINTNSIGEDYRALADGVLQKPFSIQVLRSLLDRTLAISAPSGGAAASQRKVLELMATVATEQESIRRQQARFMGLINSLDASESRALAEQFKEFGMALEASLARFAARLEEIRELLDASD